jgi:hypothetical protein
LILNPEGAIASFSPKKRRHHLFVVEVPAASLTLEQRAELSGHTLSQRNTAEPAADFYLDSVFNADVYPRFAEASPEVVPLILDALIAHRQKQEADKLAKHEAAVKAWLGTPIANWVKQDYGDFSVREYVDGNRRPEDARLAATLLEAEALAAKMTAELRAEKEAERQENERLAAIKKAEHEAGVNALREWAVAHGSELLRARIEDGFEWKGLAEQEYSRAAVDALGIDAEEVSDTPAGFLYEDSEERTTPTLAEIALLRRIRSKASEFTTAKLLWIKYEAEGDEDWDEDEDKEELKRCEVEITVRCPNGAERSFYFLAPGD